MRQQHSQVEGGALKEHWPELQLALFGHKLFPIKQIP
jgi:hypothetical protein